MIENYQERRALTQNAAVNTGFATVGQVYSDGVTLIFPGSDTPTQKHYKANTSIVFHPGDKVRIAKKCKTYVVEYPVGNPRKA